MESEHGAKRVTEENWLEPDAAAQLFVRLNPDGTTSPHTGEEWCHLILSVTLSDRVPEDVRKLFVVARGAMVYGWFFYPLFTLGVEQCFRVVEAAATARYLSLGGPITQTGLAGKIKWLKNEGAIDNEISSVLEEARRWRNEASHPRVQQIVPPAAAVHLLRRCSGLIEALYNEPISPKVPPALPIGGDS